MTATLPDPIRTEAYIDGRFVPAASGETFESINPATGEHLGDIAACGPGDVDTAVASARRAFDSGSWSRMHPSERKEVLLRLVALLEEHAEELALSESIDAGKPITDCRGFDLPDTIGTMRWYAEAADKVFGKTTPAGDGALGIIVHEPIGVVGAVLPWNFPLAMLAWKLGPALAAGNPVVVKPPELTTLTTLRFAELATEAGLPAGVLNVVPGLGHVTGKALGLHQDVDVISFTGSNEIGREFLRYSADSNLKNVILEMGGKSPQIVTADNADRLQQVAEDLAEAAFGNMGQNCSAGSRILVDASIAEEFVGHLVTLAEASVVGDPQDPATTVGSLIEESALARVAGYVDDAKAAGASVRSGGEQVRADSGGWFYPPTVVTDVTEDMAIAREEIFGPVVVVMPFQDIDDAIRIANDTIYGLAATVWSRDIDDALRLARSVRAGTVSVNGYSEGDITTPFGGYRQSGFGGRDNGLEAFAQYTETKTIFINLH
ncbi:aldehyde dehydrogenase [Kocuria palustris]|uniref:aldehyde dehydrogenase n=1 Tax=Kocuria palustris TaxID=71999 RepID=UPI00045E7AB7|nr:aldehyde dehydrogenase [Kocuria palustris]ALB03240.1 aldehyde dehydrogenase [Kocuria palustris]